MVAFLKPLVGWLRFSINYGMASHALLVPFISLYLVWPLRKELASKIKASPMVAIVPLVLGLLLIVAYWTGIRGGWQPKENDYLAICILAFLLFFIAGCFLFFGAKVMRSAAFPAAFLIFMVPLPIFLTNAMTLFLQHASAETAHALLQLSGTPFFRTGLTFQLPGISLQVAEECSGIRSSLVLLITGLLAAQIFLRTPWKKALLTFAVIPLGILRNGFRIFAISLLCVHVDPSMIDSPLHHRGGPVFFALSLVPFFLLLLWLRRSDFRGQRAEAGNRTDDKAPTSEVGSRSEIAKD